MNTPSTLSTARIFWINGPGSSGTGKSTLAYTIALALSRLHPPKLGASFFCTRTLAECSNPRLVFTTLARQLGVFCPAFGEEVDKVVKADPSVGYTILSSQLERLIVNPLKAVQARNDIDENQKMPFCVVVIDALDECKEGGATYTILSTLAQFITQLSPLKFLITSRPEQHIIGAFRLASLEPTTHRYILHQVEPKVAERDVRLYLQFALRSIRDSYGLDGRWPAEDDVQDLVRHSAGLFIFAATAVKWIRDNNHSDPQGRLSDVLISMNGKGQSKARSRYMLDDLYLEVLQRAFPSISPESSEMLKIILGSIALLFNPLSLSDLQELLRLPGTLHTYLRDLQSVVIIPDDAKRPVYLIHPSFREFLINPELCKEPSFRVLPNLRHAHLAQVCLGTMKSLKRNMCHIKQPWELHSEIANLGDLVQRNIAPSLQYACQYWAQHLAQIVQPGSGISQPYVLLSDQILDVFTEFCDRYLLYWIEVCSLLGDLRGALSSLNMAHSVFSVSGYPF